MPDLHLDITGIESVIKATANAAADATACKLQAERIHDEVGKLLWGKKETAAAMSISVSTLGRLISEGELKVVRLSGRVLISPEAVREWIARREGTS